MKFIILSVFLLQSLWACSEPNTTTANNLIQEVPEHVQFKIDIACDLISYEPCEGRGVSVKVEVRVYITNNYGIRMLVSQQTVSIPCGAGMDMTRPEFDKYVIEAKDNKLTPVTEYLDQNDDDGSIFQKVSNSISETINGLKQQLGKD